MRSLTRLDVETTGVPLLYLVPFAYEKEVSDQEWMQRLSDTMDNVKWFRGLVKKDIQVEIAPVPKLHLAYWYQGYDQYYPFEMSFELVQMEDSLLMMGNACVDSRWLEELIDQNIRPEWEARLGLTRLRVNDIQTI